jgi:hypothetical protein
MRRTSTRPRSICGARPSARRLNAARYPAQRARLLSRNAGASTYNGCDRDLGQHAGRAVVSRDHCGSRACGANEASELRRGCVGDLDADIGSCSAARRRAIFERQWARCTDCQRTGTACSGAKTMIRASSLFSPPAKAMSRRFAVGDAFSRRAFIRIVHVVLIVLFVAASVFAFRAAEQKRRDLAAAQSAAAWRNSGVVATNASLDTFAASWSAQRATNSGQTTLTWSARDARDLRTSLLAFDATKANAQRIEVTRRETGFAIIAEIMQ